MVARPLGQLWIEGERILGERPAETAVPSGVPVVDTSGCTLLPGLFDLHVHVSVPGAGLGVMPDVTPEDNLRTHLACGVTNVVDLHADPAMIFPLRDRSRTAPDLARLYAAGAAFTVPGGHPTQFGMAANTVTSVAEVDQRFAELLPHHPDVIKAILEHGGWSVVPKIPTLDETLFAAITERAHHAKLPVFCHVWSRDEALAATRGGANALAHGVYLGEVDDELISEMQERGVAYIPTLAVVVGGKRVAEKHSPYGQPLVASALDPELYEIVAKTGGTHWATMGAIGGGDKQYFTNLKMLADAGIEIGTGTDAGNPLTPHGPALLYEIMLYVEAGLTPARALRAATLGSARILGVADRFGSLATGKIADVVVVRGDPTRTIGDLWHVEQVFKGGARVDREALAKEDHRAQREHEGAEGGAATSRRGSTASTTGDLDADWHGTWQAYCDTCPARRQVHLRALGEGRVLVIKGSVKDGFQYGAFAGAEHPHGMRRRRCTSTRATTTACACACAAPASLLPRVQRGAVKDYNVFTSPLIRPRGGLAGR
jgi:imidazolonepropionase-like amidohydrolase